MAQWSRVTVTVRPGGPGPAGPGALGWVVAVEWRFGLGAALPLARAGQSRWQPTACPESRALFT